MQPSGRERDVRVPQGLAWRRCPDVGREQPWGRSQSGPLGGGTVPGDRDARCSVSMVRVHLLEGLVSLATAPCDPLPPGSPGGRGPTHLLLQQTPHPAPQRLRKEVSAVARRGRCGTGRASTGTLGSSFHCVLFCNLRIMHKCLQAGKRSENMRGDLSPGPPL